MNLNLQDKVFIVTGGAKGIGAAIMRELVNEQAIPVNAGRSPVSEVQLGISASDVHSITVELGTAESCRGVVQEVLRVSKANFSFLLPFGLLYGNWFIWVWESSAGLQEVSTRYKLDDLF